MTTENSLEAPVLASPATRSIESWSVQTWTRLNAGLAVLMVALQAPFAHLSIDDFIHRVMLMNREGDFGRPPWDLFRFFRGVPGEVLASQERGWTPWFADPELKLAFFRPLSSALIALDNALFGDFAAAYLVHSGLWYVALCALAAVWFQRHLRGTAGGLAAIVFALAPSHAQPVSWFAARNALIAGVFGLLAVLAHELWREGRGGRFRWFALGAVGLALCAGEAGLGSVALITAFELSRAQVTLKERALGLGPVFAVAAAYFIIHVGLNYGTNLSGAYINPLQEPGHYLVALPTRLLTSMGVLFLGVPATLWFFVPTLRGILMQIGVAVVVAAGVWVFAVYKRLSEPERRTAALFGLALLGALLPQLAGLLGPRSYLIPSLGSSALIGLVVSRALLPRYRFTNESRFQLWLGRVGAGLLLVLGVAIGPLQWLQDAKFLATVDQKTVERRAALELDSNTERTDSVVLLSSPDPFIGIYTPFVRTSERLPMPAEWRLLSLAQRAHNVRRTSDHSFELEVVEGDLLNSAFAEIYRHPARPFTVGQEVVLHDLTARVLAVSARGQPTRVEFRTARSLDDPGLKLFGWSEGRMQRIRLKPGEALALAWVAPY
jgi:hypothetical protein